MLKGVFFTLVLVWLVILGFNLPDFIYPETRDYTGLTEPINFEKEYVKNLVIPGTWKLSKKRLTKK